MATVFEGEKLLAVKTITQASLPYAIPANRYGKVIFHSVTLSNVGGAAQSAIKLAGVDVYKAPVNSHAAFTYVNNGNRSTSDEVIHVNQFYLNAAESITIENGAVFSCIVLEFEKPA